MKRIILLNDFAETFKTELSLAIEALNGESVSINSCDLLMDLGNGYDKTPCLVSSEGLFSVNKEDVVFARNRKPNVFYSTLLLQFFEALGLKTLNKVFKQHHKNTSKQAQYINLIANGFRIPRTVIVPGEKVKNFLGYIQAEFLFPFVMKIDGSCGRGVWKINSIDEVEKYLVSADKSKAEAVVFQEYVTNSKSEYRTLCLNGAIVEVITRSSENFLNNHAQGGIVTQGVLTEAEQSLCLQAAKISGLDYLGVDFMKNESGNLIFIELQSGPSISVSKIVNTDVLKKMAKILLS